MLSTNQEKIMILLTKLWKDSSELRFNQFLHNLQHDFNRANDEKYTETLYRSEVGNPNLVIYAKTDVVDLFNVEDSIFLKFLEDEVIKLEGIALPANARLKTHLSFGANGVTRNWNVGDVVTVIKKIESNNFGSKIGYVIMNNNFDSLTVDSTHLDFYYKGDDK